MICSKLFIIPSFNRLVGRSFEYTFDISKFKPIFPYLSDLTNITIKIQLDTCKVGEVYDGIQCMPCPLNTYSRKERMEGSVLQCTACTDRQNYYCYGAKYISPKWYFLQFWAIIKNSNYYKVIKYKNWISIDFKLFGVKFMWRFLKI